MGMGCIPTAVKRWNALTIKPTEEGPLTFTVLEFFNGHNFIGLLQHRVMSEKSMCSLSLYQNTPAEMKVHGAHKGPLLLSDCLICTVHVQISAEMRIKSDGSLLSDFVLLFPGVF